MTDERAAPEQGAVANPAVALRAAATEAVKAHDVGDLRVADPGVIDRLRSALAHSPAAPETPEPEALNAAIRKVWESGHSDLRSGLTTTEGKRLADAIVEAMRCPA